MITEIRKTAYADIPAVMTLFDKARQTMAALGIDQWQDGYPFESNIRADVSHGESYVVLCDGHIAATFMCMTRTVHRITVSPDARRSAHSADGGKSISAEIMDFVKAKAARENLTGGIRIDTHTGNVPMRKMLEKQGFVYCGVIWLESGAERVAYQYLP